MNTIEQRIWDYLDNSCTQKEHQEIKHLIETDPDYKTVYNELKDLSQVFSSIELDEPSMGFTRNVMNKVNLEPLTETFKSTTDKRIIYGIAAFFLLSISAMLAVVFYQMDWSQPVSGTLQQYKLPDVNFSSYLNSTVINSFFFADIILALYLLDNFLRKDTQLTK
ncbi:hypothetical protein [Daejeonella oryzae]|uniref:hypothetical protein n=1 Tax=Daejeonella oryzae TaxID=1122943 RepID=UPI000409E578|nr:hypothetical protein [Daejeonella oryzae]